MHKQWIIERSGSTIRFVNSWFSGAKLYIDGELKDFDKSMMVSSKYAFLSGSFQNNSGQREIVEVFTKSKLLSVGFLITSNGEEILRENY